MNIWDENLEQIKENLSTYQKNYEPIFQRALHRGAKPEYLGDKQNRTCRFCSKTRPEVKFGNKAHALPESIGNRILRTWYECDTCNSIFGEGIENDFANWSAMPRTFSVVNGKGGAPKLKIDQWSVGLNETGNVVEILVGDPSMIEHDIDAHEFRITLRAPTYTPQNVLKAFYKMALSIMPEKELEYYADTLRWVGNSKSTTCEVPIFTTIFCSTIPGNLPFSPTEVLLLKRTSMDQTLPYVSLAIGCGNIYYQILLPSSAQSKETLNVLWCPLKVAFVNKAWPQQIDLSETQRATGTQQTITLTYDPATLNMRTGNPG